MSDFTGEKPKPQTPESIGQEAQNVEALTDLLKILKRNPAISPDKIFPPPGKK